MVSPVTAKVRSALLALVAQCQKCQELLLWQSYTLRNVVCFQVSQGRSGPHPLLD
jgi:hypothetical protein